MFKSPGGTIVTVTFFSCFFCCPGGSEPPVGELPPLGGLPPPLEETVIEIVFVSESVFVGLIYTYIVCAPVVAEDDALIVHVSPELCPPAMSEGLHCEDVKWLGKKVIVPNLAVVSPVFWKFRLSGNVEPCVTLDDDVLAVADNEGGFLTSNDALPESGVHEPETLTEIDWAFALLAVTVVHEAVDPLRDLVWLSDTLQTPQLLKSR